MSKKQDWERTVFCVFFCSACGKLQCNLADIHVHTHALINVHAGLSRNNTNNSNNNDNDKIHGKPFLNDSMAALIEV